MSKDEKKSSIIFNDLAKIIQGLGEIEIENVSLFAEELALEIKPLVSTIASNALQKIGSVKEQVIELAEKNFVPQIESFSGKISEVPIGALKSEGGTRKSILKIGGNSSMPFYTFESDIINRPVFAMDIFDTPLTLAKMVKIHYEDVMEDPAEWAKKVVNFGADVVSLNLISTDPLLSDSSPKEAAKVVENVLQAVDVPLIIGGSGNMQKDPIVLEAAAEAASGERVVLNSAKTDNDYKRIVKAAIKYGHSVIAFTPMDINNQKKLNRMLLDEGISKDRIIIDPTTAALGYGIDYSLSLMERIKLAGLLGDEDLQMPILAPASNAWGAREAWMKNEEWGPREYRGPLWETITTLTILMAGGDIFMVSHPATVKVIKQIVTDLLNKSNTGLLVDNWITKLG